MDEEKQTRKIPSKRQHSERWIGNGIRIYDLRYFVTLTFIDDVNKDAAKRTIREFIKRLNKQCFGRRYCESSEYELKQICVVEQNALRTTVHYHIMFSDPFEVSNRNQARDFKSTIYKSWRAFNTSGKTHLNRNDEWFKEIPDSDGLAGYLTKTEKYIGMDFFDFENTNVPYH